MNRMRLLMSGIAMSAMLVMVISCNQSRNEKPKTDPAASKKGGNSDDHSHGRGPHKGAIGDWGNKYHIEFIVDHDKKEATVYILGSDETTPAPIKAKDNELLLTIDEPKFQVPLKALPEKGDPEGKASRFIAKDDRFGKVQEFSGIVSGEADSTPYSGKFTEESDPNEKKKK